MLKNGWKPLCWKKKKKQKKAKKCSSLGFQWGPAPGAFFPPHLILFLLSLFLSLNAHAWLRNCRLSNRLFKKKRKKRTRRTATVSAYQTAEAPPSDLNGPHWSPFESQHAFVAVNHLRFINIMLLSIDFFFFPLLPPGIILSLHGDVARCIENGQFALEGCSLRTSTPRKIQLLNPSFNSPPVLILLFF